ncbi:MAG: hypothetical protein DRH79_01175 [Candidatus Cloacimonadota bacterium]|nr:MAG: hypothetical protein DRH79_01175 [Candidatus Cloacimonadota bacterium]
MDKRRVLIVEDETIVAEDIKRILLKRNFEIIGNVTNGHEALKIIKEKKPNLVLLDIMLEDEIDGIQVADQIVAQNIPFIYVTAYADDEKIEQAKHTMPFGYLLKPFRERELIATIEMAFFKHDTDKKLKESMKNYKRILDNIQDVYYEVTVDGNILQISPSIEEISSYRMEDILGASLFQIYYNPDDRDVFLSKLTKDGFVTDYPLILKDKDGTPFTCLCSCKLIVEDDSDPKIIGSLRNISERLEKKKELKDSQERYKILFESNPDAVMLQDEKSMVDCNEAALKLFGFTYKDELKGFGPGDFSPMLQPDGRNSLELINKNINKAFTQGSAQFNWTYRKRNGTTFPAMVWLNLYKHNNKPHLLVNIKDVTDIHISQEKLQRSYNQMELVIKERTSELTNTNRKLLNEIQVRKEAEKKAKDGEVFYNALFENNPIETIVVDRNGTVVSYNRAVTKNRSRFPKVGDIMYKDYAGKYDVDMYGELIDCIKIGKIKQFSEARYKDKVWSITIAPFEKGAIIASIDVSRQKFAEEQIMKLNKVFQNLSSDPCSNIEYIVQQAGEIIHSSCCLYYKLDKNKEKIELTASYHAPDGLLKTDSPENHICFQEIIKSGKNDVNICNLDLKKYSDIDPSIHQYGLKSLLGFPVRYQHEIIGTLCAFDVTKRTFSKNESYILSTLTKTISIEEERLKILNALKQVSKLQRLILNTARSFNSSLEFEEVTRRITSEAMEILDSYGGTVYTLSEDGRTLKPIIAIDPEFADEIMATELDIDSSFTGQAIKKRTPLMFNDAGLNENGYQIPGTTVVKNERILVAPFISGKNVLGAIVLNRIGSVFTEEDLALLETLASFATSSLKNAQAYKQLKHEVTERSRAEIAKEESEKKYSTLHANVPVGIFRTSHDGTMLSVNRTMVKMLRFKSSEELLQVKMIDIFENRSDQEKLLQILEDKGEIENFEVKLKRSDGSVFWSVISVKASFENQNLLFQDGIIKDITKRKEAEISLMKTQNRLVTLFQNVPDLILYETGGKEEFVSANIKHLLGYPAEDFINDPDKFNSLIHEEDQEYINEKYEEWIDNDQEGLLTLWFRVKKSDGSYLWMEDRRVKLTDETDRSYESGVKIDITNLKQAEERLKSSLDKLKSLLHETIHGLVSAVEMRDPYTAGHQRRVALLATAIAQEMKLPDDQIDGLNLAALVHDIGKINVPAEILSKPGILTETEFNLIKMHPQTGYEILKTIQFPWPVAEIVLQHQERYDGSAYPQGLKGNEINLCARILGVADVIEAMSSHRPYRPSLGIDKALAEIKNNRGKYFDPEVVDACLNLFSEKGFYFTEEDGFVRN